MKKKKILILFLLITLLLFGFYLTFYYENYSSNVPYKTKVYENYNYDEEKTTKIKSSSLLTSIIKKEDSTDIVITFYTPTEIGTDASVKEVNVIDDVAYVVIQQPYLTQFQSMDKQSVVITIEEDIKYVKTELLLYR